MNRKWKAFLAVSAGVTLLSVLGCASSKPYVEQPIEGGTKVPGESLTEKLAWLESNADSRNNYILEVNANENIAPRTLEYSGAKQVGVVIRGVGENRTIRLSEHGTMFTVKPNITFVLDENITLMGHEENTGPMVYVDGGLFWMRTGSRVSDNPRDDGNGGGVYVSKGMFALTGGIVSGNKAQNGGGVYVAGGVFFMHNGAISGNTATENGGGVYVRSNEYSAYSERANIPFYLFGGAAFQMYGGTINGNTAVRGGGLYLDYNKQYETMGSSTYVANKVYIRDAVITDNIVSGESGEGGGVYLKSGAFIVEGKGLIPGYDRETNSGNRKVGGVGPNDPAFWQAQKYGKEHGLKADDAKVQSVTDAVAISEGGVNYAGYGKIRYGVAASFTCYER
jgi:hypothetical protein